MYLTFFKVFSPLTAAKLQILSSLMNEIGNNMIMILNDCLLLSANFQRKSKKRIWRKKLEIRQFLSKSLED